MKLIKIIYTLSDKETVFKYMIEHEAIQNTKKCDKCK